MEGKVYGVNDIQRGVLEEIQQARNVVETNLKVLAWSAGVPRSANFQVLPDCSGFLVLPTTEK